ncbi:MAG: sel1 repeat family protein [Gammaproteobacteria bacterium]|nr:MAG: sel1 repeat family protein [Gammaproteobacteria bacterium]
MARRRPALLAVLGVLAVGAALAVGTALAAPQQFSRAADPLEGVKTAIRLKKFAEAATALQKLASAGNADAQYMLAVFYLNGVNGPRDPAQARGWLEKSAGQGNARAAFSLANLFAESDPPDSQAAEHWLARARQLGFSAPTAPPGAAAAQQGPPSSLLPAAQLARRRGGLGAGGDAAHSARRSG